MQKIHQLRKTQKHQKNYPVIENVANVENNQNFMFHPLLKIANISYQTLGSRYYDNGNGIQ